MADPIKPFIEVVKVV
jgi:hypothetical protein